MAAGTRPLHRIRHMRPSTRPFVERPGLRDMRQMAAGTRQLHHFPEIQIKSCIFP